MLPQQHRGWGSADQDRSVRGRLAHYRSTVALSGAAVLMTSVVADDLGPGEPPEVFPAVAVAEYPLVVPGLVEHAEVAGDHLRFDMFW